MITTTMERMRYCKNLVMNVCTERGIKKPVDIRASL
jgi:hypothetical protein